MTTRLGVRSNDACRAGICCRQARTRAASVNPLGLPGGGLICARVPSVFAA
jgi:hypothetical protein